MIVYPVETSLVRPGDSLSDVLVKALAKSRIRLKRRDIVAVSSKIVGISERRIIELHQVKPGQSARKLAKRYSLPPQFVQTVVDEADEVLGGVRRALLTINKGDAVANAGIDRKNAPSGSVVLWPRDPDSTAGALRASIKKKLGKDVGVLIVDSRVTPLRRGTIGLAIGCAGFKPVEDVRGREDLFGRSVEITFRAVADGIAATAQLVMGEASDMKPFAIIRGAPVQFGATHGIRAAKLTADQCLYMSQIHYTFT